MDNPYTEQIGTKTVGSSLVSFLRWVGGGWGGGGEGKPTFYFFMNIIIVIDNYILNNLIYIKYGRQ